MTTGNAVLNDRNPGYVTKEDAPYHTAAESRFPRDGKTYEPAFILTGEKPRPGMDPRKELARIMTSHVQFNRATVNIVWGKLMTVGFVEPYDGFDLAAARSEQSAARAVDGAADQPVAARGDGRGLPGAQLQPASPDEEHHEVERVSALHAVPGRVEGQLRAVLRAPVTRA